jgi:hypothetical protein
MKLVIYDVMGEPTAVSGYFPYTSENEEIALKEVQSQRLAGLKVWLIYIKTKEDGES